jgi:hypothetical protein
VHIGHDAQRIESDEGMDEAEAALAERYSLSEGCRGLRT